MIIYCRTEEQISYMYPMQETVEASLNPTRESLKDVRKWEIKPILLRLLGIEWRI